MTPFWVVMPYLGCWDLTQQAITDCLAQTGLPSPPQILAIDTGSPLAIRAEMEAWMEREPRLHGWFHRPGLPSLSATWNLGLRFVWQMGGEVALVINNDTRCHHQTYATLLAYQRDERALFVSAVGRREGDMNWDEFFQAPTPIPDHPDGGRLTSRGGPDFSCFLITRECHQSLAFDENHVPAYLEDCTYHRELMLRGDGQRIFSVNLPFLHYGSATVNADPSKRAHWAKRIEQSRAYYRARWGGNVNEERYTIPFEAQSDQDGVTNPELQARILHAPAPESV